MTTVPPTATPTLDDEVTRLKTSIPLLIQAAQAGGSTPPPEGAAVTELATLADQIDAAVAALAGPGTVTPPAAAGGAVDPGAPAAAAAPAS